MARSNPTPNNPPKFLIENRRRPSDFLHDRENIPNEHRHRGQAKNDPDEAAKTITQEETDFLRSTISQHSNRNTGSTFKRPTFEFKCHLQKTYNRVDEPPQALVISFSISISYT